jgi:ketosteroid isomerase-like protein
LKSTEVESNGDLAYEVGDFSLDVPGEGGSFTTSTGNYLVVWKRDADGVWRLKVDTWNDAPAPKP